MEQTIPTLTDTAQPLYDIPEPQQKWFKQAAWFSYAVAYLYVMTMLEVQWIYFFPLAVGMIALVEFLARHLHRPLSNTDPKMETYLFMSATLIQAFMLSVSAPHPQMEWLQLLMLHGCFIFYAAARNGQLIQQRLGIMAWLDIFHHAIIVPFSNLLLRKYVLMHKADSDSDENNADNSPSSKMRTFLFAVVTLIVLVYIVHFTLTQLGQVSENFNAFTENFALQLNEWMEQLFDSNFLSDVLIYITLSVPIGMWIFGLVGGSLLSNKMPTTYEQFHEKIRPLQVFPLFTAYMIIGALCVVYGLFFVVAASEFSTMLSASAQQPISPQLASFAAVSGFWQLVRVSLMNFGILLAFYFFLKERLWDLTASKIALTVLFSFATLFALLAGWKLFGIYIFLYGPTPLRLLSGWFILVLLCGCALTLIRLYKPIQAIRIGIFYTIISFTLLCCIFPLIIR